MSALEGFLVGLTLGVLLERLRLWVYGPDPLE